MGEIRPMETACLLIGVLCREDEVLTSYMKNIREFGQPEIISPCIHFDFTEYYTPTMGAPLSRRFYLFPPGFQPETLPDIKIRTNEIEKEAARTLDLGVERPVNLDPGYLTLSKLVLASTKDHSHRIYLRDGIFAEITLYYRAKTFSPGPYTFPDYASETYIRFFNGIRNKLLRKR
ncbi:MAG: DUF4416 family protein [Planctomycetota bacterium]